MDKNDASRTLVSATTRRNFGNTVESLIDLVETYLKRDFSEDIDKLRKEGIECYQENLKTNFDKGLSSSDEFESRIEFYGSNKKPEPELDSFCKLCLEPLSDKINIVLLILGVASLIIGAAGEHPEYGWVEGFAILLVVFIIVMVSSTMNYSKQNKFRELQQIHKNRAGISILRDGEKNFLHPEEVLVGDIVMLATGDIIPCDGIVLQSHSLLVNEAALTGENDLMHKEDLKHCNKIRRQMLKVAKENDMTPNKHDIPSPIVISGTSVAQGTAKIVSIAVGPNSKEGRISELAEQEVGNTPLEEKLDDVADKISLIGLGAGLFALVGLYLRFFIRLGMEEYEWEGKSSITELIGYFLLAFTVIAVAIPEGLPLAVTICLAYSVKKMQKDNNLVKKLPACETMGGVDMICSDKTGTLTQNMMVLKRFGCFFGRNDIKALDEEKLHKLFARSHDFFNLLKEGVSLCTEARVEAKENPADNGAIVEKDVGSQTELAVIKMLRKIPDKNDDYLNIRKNFEESILKINPFSSERKKSSIIVERPDGTKRVYVIGAPDFIIKHCSHGIDLEMNIHSVGEEEQLNFIGIQEDMAKFGLRTLSIAFRDLESDEPIDEVNQKGHPVLESKDLVVIGVFGIYDPPRPGVDIAIAKCNRAGIRVRMVTGDNAKTAEAIAHEINITSDFSRVMEGPKFNDLVGGVMCSECTTEKVCECPRQGKDAREDVVKNFEVFKEIIESIDVLARSAPEDKYTMVTGLKQMGHVVAVTGDGTNDAPALRKANVGFAMGIAGTEYARQAADIILVDDNFGSIVKAADIILVDDNFGSIVKAAVWGRGIYDNIQKFIQFQLTVNVVAVICAIVGAITIQQSALTAVQMLWVNMIMDSMASLALATEEPTEEVLDRKPNDPNEFIATPLMFKHIFGQAICMIALIFAFMYDGENIFREFEDNDKICRNPDNHDFVCSGRLYKIDSGDDYKEFLYDLGPSRHFTYIFNIFVWFQIFNEFNARRIRDEINFLQGITKSAMFISVFFITAAVQILIVEVGSWAFFVSKYGMTVEQWFTCIAWGLVPIPFRFFLLLIPGFGKKKIKALKVYNSFDKQYSWWKCKEKVFIKLQVLISRS
ncbi:hypothetical protein SteCoe_21289 [Stentor coeruleus]|uniref:P-type sodium-transporting ATPase4 n=1 Tax=Stentor coeruleus TaxID=5963 RepID=A0A1R2BQ01_9CILI|nr:hypothetical protein SteCoe_21289 [Stentor coeruleus]